MTQFRTSPDCYAPFVDYMGWTGVFNGRGSTSGMRRRWRRSRALTRASHPIDAGPDPGLYTHTRTHTYSRSQYACTHVPDSPSFEVPDIHETTTWRDLTGALSEAELSCVQGELDEELYEGVLDGLVLRDIEAVEPWQGLLVGCLSQDTADDLFIATLEAGPEELSEESETCVRGILAGSDWRPIVFSQDPEGVEEAMTFGFNMMGCLFTDGMDEMGEMDLGEMDLDEMEEFFGEDFDIDGP